jgi:hypothetical protein
MYKPPGEIGHPGKAPSILRVGQDCQDDLFASKDLMSVTIRMDQPCRFGLCEGGGRSFASLLSLTFGPD